MSKIIGLLAIAIVLLANSVSAKDTPATSSKYTVQQADSMYYNYKMDYKKDIKMPENLTVKFNQDFPNARDVEWEGTDFMSRAEFEEGRYDYKAYYDKEGNLVLYKKEIPTSSLPKTVQDAIISKYPKFKIDDAEAIHKGNTICYEVQIEKGDLDIELIIDEKGQIVSEKID